MKQFDIYSNTDPDTSEAYLYFVDVQTELPESLNSRVVIPLTKALPEKALPKNICPEIEIQGVTFVLLTYQITTVPGSFLKEYSGTVVSVRNEIINSPDVLIAGI